MKKKINVFFIAAMISITSLSLVLGWYYLTAPEIKSTLDQQPIAYINRIKDEVDRRPARRQIWQSILEGEPIYSGEAIRTAKNSEARIQFADSTRTINLEPESIVMLSKSSNQDFSLDLMEGGASVVADKGSSGTLTLLKDGKSVELKGDVTLSKSGADLEIQNESEDEGSTFFANNSDKRLTQFKLLSPVKNQYLFVDVDNPNVLLSWEGLPQDLKVKVVIGTQRDKLTHVHETQDKQMNLTLLPGFYFYKMYLINQQSSLPVAVSKLQRLKVIERKMPLLVNPSPNQFISIVSVTSNPKYKINFEWTKGELVQNYIFEVATDKLMRSKVLAQSFDVKKNNIEADLSPATYYYRMSAVFETEGKVITGKIEQFTISLNKQMDPTTIGVNLIKWVKSNEQPLATDGNEQQFFIGEPYLNLKWETEIPDKIKEYKIKLISSDDPYAPSQEFSSTDLKFKTKLFKPGRYIASLQGVDQSLNVVANSSKKVVYIKELTKVKAPSIIGEDTLTAQKNGYIKVFWKPEEGAYKYQVKLIDESGRTLQSQTVENLDSPEISFTDLLPGSYMIEVAGVDMLERAGDISKRKITVLNESDIDAPKMMKVKVK